MEIEYIFRPKSSRFVSIENVFGSVIEEMKQQPNVIVYRSEVKKMGWWPITMIYNIVRYAVKSYRYDRIFHITGDIQYVGCFMNPKRTILTIHDLVSFHAPDVPKYARFISRWMSYYLPLKRLNKITCISETTKRDLLSFFPWTASKVRVICNPVSSRFVYVPKEMNKEHPTILHIGTKTNKNLERVADALNKIPCHLRIVGKLSETQKVCLSRNGIDYSNAYGLTDEEIVNEYVNADIISFPSLFEGFGMPIIEGQAVGRPVVTSNIEPMLSVAGSGAVFVSPTDVDSIKSGFLYLISRKDIDDIVTKGLNNAGKYHAKAIAQEYIRNYLQ